MKKLIFITIILAACSKNDDPVFKIDSGNAGIKLESRFDSFVQQATARNITVPRKNMVLRYVSDNNVDINDSKNYKKDGQLYIDIDLKFIEANVQNENALETIVFQQLSNGLLGTAFTHCGMMWKIETRADVEGRNFSSNNYDTLFSPC